MKTKILILLAINAAMFTNVKAQCLSCNVNLSGTITTSVSYTSKEICGSGNIIVDNGVSLTLNVCEFSMTSNATIIVKQGATLNVIGSHLFGCTEMWQGIDVEEGGVVNIYNYQEVSSLIEDAFVAVNFTYSEGGIQYNYTGVPYLKVDDVIFNRNEVGIQVSRSPADWLSWANPMPSYFEVGNCVFTCRQILPPNSNPFTWTNVAAVKLTTISAATTYPNTPASMSSPYINNNTFSDNNVDAFLKQPYAPYTMKSKVGIKLNQIFFGENGFTVGYTNGNQTNNRVTIFDNHDIGIETTESQFTLHNCTFQKPNANFTTTPYYNINATGVLANNTPIGLIDPSLAQHHIKIETVGGSPNNAFFDLQYAIHGEEVGRILVNKCDIRSSQNINTQSSLQTSYNGFVGIYLSSSFYYNTSLINNEIYNEEYGIWLNNFGGANISYVPQAVINVSNNIVAHAFNPTTTAPLFNGQFVRNAIILSSTQPASGIATAEEVNCRNNKVYKAFNGISVSSFKGFNTHTDFNVVTLAEDPNISIYDEYYGVQAYSGEPAPNIDPLTGLPYTDPNYYGNTVINNVVTGNGDDKQQVAIDVAQQMGTHYGCNLAKSSTHGIRFYGDNPNTRFWNNEMDKTNQYGFTLKNAFIDQQGTVNGCTSDNLWIGNQAAWFAVNTSLPHYKTFADNSDALSSLLVVQNNADMDPSDNGLGSIGLTFPFPVYLPYDVGNGNIVLSTSGSADCGRCNGDGKIQVLARSSNLLEQIANGTVKVPADDAAKRKYVMQQQLFQQLKANPELITQSTDLQNFINTNQWTGLDFINYTGYFLGKGDVATADLLLNYWTPSNKELDNNYYIFYDWLATMYSTPSWKPNQADVLALAIKCPLKSGNVVYAARNLYNSLTKKINTFTNNCDVNTPQNRGIQQPIAIEQIQVYPNPTNGLVNIKLPYNEKGNWQVSVSDIYGKKIAEKKLEQNIINAQLNLAGSKGLYFVNVYNNSTGKQQISKIILQ